MPFDGRDFGDPTIIRELDFLIRARAAVDTPQKWCKHRVVKRGRVCMTGALMSAAGMTQVSMRWSVPTIYSHCVPAAARRAYNILAWYLPVRFEGSVEQFNDSSYTRHADVLKVFDHAITDWTAKAGRL